MRSWFALLKAHWQLPPDDLLRDSRYRRLWSSILISSFGGQITLLAIPLTAAVLLQATPTQMGWLTAMELLPFALLSLPAGVWLDRVRKLPVYITCELTLAAAVASIPLVWSIGSLAMPWLYGVAFVVGVINVVGGSAAQIVLNLVVPREKLVQAHARGALASSAAEVAGPGVAGVLIRLLGGPLALLTDAALLVSSAAILRGVPVPETVPDGARPSFWKELGSGWRFVRGQPLLRGLALLVGAWQLVYQMALVVQILFATRVLHLSEAQVGLSYVAVGIGTVSTSLVGERISQRIGPGPSMALGAACTATGWALAALAPPGPWGIAAFVLMLMLFGVGAILLFINFIALRQSVTPEPLLGRMTSTMRWLALLPAGPGALLGGWLGEHLGLRETLGLAALGAVVLCGAAVASTGILHVRRLPAVAPADAQPCASSEPA